jgi:hypothetical protein
MEITRENRQFPRLSLVCDLIVTVMPNGKPQPAVSVDISRRGLGLYAKSPLNRGQIVQIDICFKDENQVGIIESVRGKVIYANSYWEGTRVGVEFLKIAQEADHPALATRLVGLFD